MQTQLDLFVKDKSVVDHIDKYRRDIDDLSFENQTLRKDLRELTKTLKDYQEAEFRRSKQDPVTVPMGYTIFPKDISYSSRRWAERRFKNIMHWSEQEKGGHFAAFEVPDTFVNEVRTCFRQIR